MNTIIRSILIVDDETSLHDLLGSILEECPVTICNALTGEEALQIISNSEEFAVVISNHNMGNGMTGGEFLKLVREQNPRTVRIMMTGGIDKDSLTEMVRQGEIDGFAIKPILVDSFINQVQQGLADYAAKLKS
jgi:DNA-binding NtrC family response regulator